MHRPAGPDRADIPVLYLLHGYPADPTALVNGSLLRRLDREMCRTGRPFVVAVPDGRAGNLDTEWGDDARGRFAIETFVTQQAVALVEGAIRRAPALRAIGGFSMGGYGAAALALRHPDEYRQDATVGDRRVRGDHLHRGDRLALAERQVGHRRARVLPPVQHDAALLSRQVTVSVSHPPGGHGNDAWYPQLGSMVDFLTLGWPGSAPQSH